WRANVCCPQNYLAQWGRATDWGAKVVASAPENLFAWVHLAAANAWAGHDKQAREALAQLQKVYPSYTVQSYAGTHYSDNLTFNAQRARILEGLRKAGLPEGDKKTE